MFPSQGYSIEYEVSILIINLKIKLFLLFIEISCYQSLLYKGEKYQSQNTRNSRVLTNQCRKNEQNRYSSFGNHHSSNW